MNRSINKEQNKTIWQEKGIPPLEYCSIHRAAKLLNCEVLDFICWASSGLIEPTFLIRDHFAAVLSAKEDLANKHDVFNFMQHEWSLSNKSSGNKFPMSWPFELTNTLGSFLEVYTDNGENEVTVDNIKITPLKEGVTSAICSISGLWTIKSIPVSHNIFHRLLTEGSLEMDCEEYVMASTVSDDSQYPTCVAFGVSQEHEETLKIGLNNCFIRRFDIERIHSGNLENNPQQLSAVPFSHSNTSSLQFSQQRHIHKNTERFATHREALLKSAINLFFTYPEECRGEKRAVSAERWAECILNHKDEIPPLMITNREVIIEKLRDSINGKLAG